MSDSEQIENLEQTKADLVLQTACEKFDQRFSNEGLEGLSDAEINNKIDIAIDTVSTFTKWKESSILNPESLSASQSQLAEAFDNHKANLAASLVNIAKLTQIKQDQIVKIVDLLSRDVLADAVQLDLGFPLLDRFIEKIEPEVLDNLITVENYKQFLTLAKPGPVESGAELSKPTEAQIKIRHSLIMFADKVFQDDLSKVKEIAQILDLQIGLSDNPVEFPNEVKLVRLSRSVKTIESLKQEISDLEKRRVRKEKRILKDKKEQLKIEREKVKRSIDGIYESEQKNGKIFRSFESLIPTISPIHHDEPERFEKLLQTPSNFVGQPQQLNAVKLIAEKMGRSDTVTAINKIINDTAMLDRPELRENLSEISNTTTATSLSRVTTADLPIAKLKVTGNQSIQLEDDNGKVDPSELQSFQWAEITPTESNPITIYLQDGTQLMVVTNLVRDQVSGKVINMNANFAPGKDVDTTDPDFIKNLTAKQYYILKSDKDLPPPETPINESSIERFLSDYPWLRNTPEDEVFESENQAPKLTHIMDESEIDEFLSKFANVTEEQKDLLKADSLEFFTNLKKARDLDKGLETIGPYKEGESPIIDQQRRVIRQQRVEAYKQLGITEPGSPIKFMISTEGEVTLEMVGSINVNQNIVVITGTVAFNKNGEIQKFVTDTRGPLYGLDLDPRYSIFWNFESKLEANFDQNGIKKLEALTEDTSKEKDIIIDFKEGNKYRSRNIEIGEDSLIIALNEDTEEFKKGDMIRVLDLKTGFAVKLKPETSNIVNDAFAGDIAPDTLPPRAEEALAEFGNILEEEDNTLEQIDNDVISGFIRSAEINEGSLLLSEQDRFIFEPELGLRVEIKEITKGPSNSTGAETDMWYLIDTNGATHPISESALGLLKFFRKPSESSNLDQAEEIEYNFEVLTKAFEADMEKQGENKMLEDYRNLDALITEKEGLEFVLNLMLEPGRQTTKGLYYSIQNRIKIKASNDEKTISIIGDFALAKALGGYAHIYKVLELIPVTEKGRAYLQSKLVDDELTTPIKQIVLQELLFRITLDVEVENRELSVRQEIITPLSIAEGWEQNLKEFIIEYKDGAFPGSTSLLIIAAANAGSQYFTDQIFKFINNDSELPSNFRSYVIDLLYLVSNKKQVEEAIVDRIRSAPVRIQPYKDIKGLLQTIRIEADQTMETAEIQQGTTDELVRMLEIVSSVNLSLQEYIDKLKNGTFRGSDFTNLNREVELFITNGLDPEEEYYLIQAVKKISPEAFKEFISPTYIERFNEDQILDLVLDFVKPEGIDYDSLGAMLTGADRALSLTILNKIKNLSYIGIERFRNEIFTKLSENLSGNINVQILLDFNDIEYLTYLEVQGKLEEIRAVNPTLANTISRRLQQIKRDLEGNQST